MKTPFVLGGGILPPTISPLVKRGEGMNKVAESFIPSGL